MMRGTISAIAPDGSYGQIAMLDGQRMSYWSNEVRNGTAQVGQAVEFQIQDNQPIDIFILPPATARPAPPPMGAPQRAAVRQDAMRVGAAAMPSAVAAPATGNYWLTLFISPRGRISRKQFWLHGILPIVIGSVVFGWIPLIGQLISLALLWASICIAFKRFHDHGYPGWWSLVYLIPLIAAGIVFALSFYYLDSDWPITVAKILWSIGGLIMLAQLIVVYVRAGQKGDNQYGPDPLAAPA
jgi:uncharacterized membrane protein YhaH (DUF805 family)